MYIVKNIAINIDQLLQLTDLNFEELVTELKNETDILLLGSNRKGSIYKAKCEYAIKAIQSIVSYVNEYSSVLEQNVIDVLFSLYELLLPRLQKELEEVSNSLE